ncbi:hypothetical protein THRCLA_11105 [Thraustotheca clavata]|uniref:Uncharacterized protein n=1 Tax=Thraustotheca clavata TaxID=74557 RepID=A0A1V9Y8S7_9STRA|nr:hypothetical protein THRCLA_11105 [Thraustotheca clavata]
MDDPTLLEMMDNMATALQQKQLDIEAIGCLEQGLLLKRKILGPEHRDVHKMFKDVVVLYNTHAMEQLKKGESESCLELLTKVEALTGRFPMAESLRILTFNNLGCYYRRMKKLKTALKYLTQAASLGGSAHQVKNLSVTHLNLCAIQSQLGRHDVALEHAQSAIFHAQEELVISEGSNDSNDVLDAQSREEKIVALAIAYHNMAVELEFNSRGDACIQWYKKALQMVFKYKDNNADLWRTFKASFDSAKKKHGNHLLSSESKPTQSRKSNKPHSPLKPTKPSTASRPARPTTASRKRPPPQSMRWHDHPHPVPSPPRPMDAPCGTSDFADFLRSKGPNAVAIASQFTTPDRQSPPPPYQRPNSGRHIISPRTTPNNNSIHVVNPIKAKPPLVKPTPPRTLQPSASNGTDITTDLFDSDEEVLEVFEEPKPAIRVERVDIRRPNGRLALQQQEEKLSTTLPERVSHFEYLKRLRQSIETNDQRAHEIASQHQKVLEMNRIYDAAARRIQSFYRGYSCRCMVRLIKKAKSAWTPRAVNLAEITIRQQYAACKIQSILRMFLAIVHYHRYRRAALERQQKECYALEASRLDMEIRAQDRRLLEEAKNTLIDKETRAKELFAAKEAECIAAQLAQKDAEAKQRQAQEEAAILKKKLEEMELQTKLLLAEQEIGKAKTMRAQQEAEKIKALLAQREAKSNALLAQKEFDKAEKARIEAEAARLLWEKQQAEAKKWIELKELELKKRENEAMLKTKANSEKEEITLSNASIESVESKVTTIPIVPALVLEGHQVSSIISELSNCSNDINIFLGIVRCASARREDALLFAHQTNVDEVLLEAQRRETEHLAASVIQGVLIFIQVVPNWLGVVKGHNTRTKVVPNAKQLLTQRKEVHHLAASVLQGLCKGCLTRNKSLRSYARELSQQFIIKQHAYVELQNAMLLEDKYVKNEAAIVISRCYRNYQFSINRTKAVIQIQAWVRGYQARLIYLALRVGYDAAIRKIQRQYRRYLSRCISNEIMKMHSIAAETLQRNLKSWVKKLNNNTIAAISNKAAHIIQSTWKSFKTKSAAKASLVKRIEMDELLMAKRLSFSCCEKIYKHHIRKTQASTSSIMNFAFRMAEAMTISLHRNVVHVEYLDEVDMATRLADRCIASIHNSYNTTLSIMIQDEIDFATRLSESIIDKLHTSLIKTNAIRDDSNIAKEITDSIADEQMPETQEKAEANDKVKVVAATYIQAIYRGYSIRKDFVKLQKDDVDKLVHIVVVDLAVTKIQAIAKGFLVRKKSPIPTFPTKELALNTIVQDVAATTIQALYRGYSRRSKNSCQSNEIVDNGNVESFQATANSIHEQNPEPKLDCVDGQVENSDIVMHEDTVKVIEPNTIEKLYFTTNAKVEIPIEVLAPSTLLELQDCVEKATKECIHSTFVNLCQVTEISNLSKDLVQDSINRAMTTWFSKHSSQDEPQLNIHFSNDNSIVHHIVEELALQCIKAGMEKVQSLHDKLTHSAIIQFVYTTTQTCIETAVAEIVKNSATTISVVHDIAATCIQSLARGYLVRRTIKRQMSVGTFIKKHVEREVASTLALQQLPDVMSIYNIAASIIQNSYRHYLSRIIVLEEKSRRLPRQRSMSATNFGVNDVVCVENQLPLSARESSSKKLLSDQQDKIVMKKDNSTASCVKLSSSEPESIADEYCTQLSQKYSESSFVSEHQSVHEASHTSLTSHVQSYSSQASFESDDIKANSSTSSLLQTETLPRAIASSNTLESLLSPELQKKYQVFLDDQNNLPCNVVDPYQILSMGLSFDSLLECLATAYDDSGVIAAADAIRVLAHIDQAIPTQNNFQALVAAITTKSTEDIDVWTAEVETCCLWLLHEFIIQAS